MKQKKKMNYGCKYFCHVHGWYWCGLERNRDIDNCENCEKREDMIVTIDSAGTGQEVVIMN